MISEDSALNGDNQILFGATVHGEFGKGSEVYLFKAAFTSKEQLYLTMGHEYLHVAFRHSGIITDFSKWKSHAVIYDWAFRQSLAWAYYGIDVQHYAIMYDNYIGMFSYNPYSYQNAGFGIIYHPPL